MLLVNFPSLRELGTSYKGESRSGKSENEGSGELHLGY